MIYFYIVKPKRTYYRYVLIYLCIYFFGTVKKKTKNQHKNNYNNSYIRDRYWFVNNAFLYRIVTTIIATKAFYCNNNI